MGKETTPPDQKRRNPEKPAPATDKQPAGKETGNRGATGNDDPDSTQRPSEEQIISAWRKPVTNQDEQEKITNTGGDDIPVPDK